MIMKKAFALMAVIVFCVMALPAAGTVPPDTLAARMWRQVMAFPQEKLYAQTDRAEYTCGDTIWVRHHIADATTGLPSYASRYAYVELLDPMGRLVRRVMMRQDEHGAIYGYVPTYTDMPSGLYMLRAYTRYMADTTPEYLFLRPLRLHGILENSVRITPELRGRTLRLSFSDSHTGQPIHGGNVKVTNGDGDVAFTGSTERGIDIHAIDANPSRRSLLVQVGNYEEYVSVPSGRIDLQLMPEGGHAVVGRRCRVAYKAVADTGLGLGMTAVVTDDKGNIVAENTATHLGMGMFSYVPQPGRSYTITCTSADGRTASSRLPKASLAIPSLSVVQNGSSLIVSVLRPNISYGATTATPHDTLWLVVHQGGAPLCVRQIDGAAIRFRRDVFRDGIVHVMLADNRMNILSERLAFVWNGRNVCNAAGTVGVSPLNDGMCRVNVSLPDSIDADCAVSVIADCAARADTAQNIVSALLLSQELRGYIEQPAWYFTGRGRSGQLDLLMMTQGWRRYDIPKVLQGEATSTDATPETGMCINGKVTSDVTPKGKRNVTVTMSSNRGGLVETAVTDENGRFCFSGFEMPDSTGYMIMARSAKGSTNLVLRMDKPTYPVVSDVLPTALANVRGKQSGDKSHDSIPDRRVDRMIFLPEVIVEERRQPRTQFEILTKLGGTSINYEKLKTEGYRGILDVIRSAGISGLQYDSTRDWFKYRGKEVYLFVDGSLIGMNYDNGETNIDTWSMIQAFMQSLKAKDVYQVDVVKGPSVNGLPGINGVGSVGFDMCAILITTNREYEPMHRTNVSLVRPLGYQKPSAVYNPRFEQSDGGRRQNTIYWNPSVRVKNGKASLTFFNGGIAKLRFRIEGIASDGKMVNASNLKK
jgi:hypothetical protein